MKYGFLLLIFVFIFQFIFAQHLTHFDNYTYVDKISGITEVSDSKILLGSEGGIISYTPENGDYQIINATRDILDLNITVVEKLNDQLSVAGSYNGKLYMIDHSSDMVIRQYNDLDNNIIVDIHNHQDTLWVATEDFVSVFTLHGESILFADLFTNFPVVPEKISKIQVLNNRLFVGAGNVLLKVFSDFGRYNLKDKNIWEVVQIADQNQPVINDLYTTEEFLFIAANSGLYQYSETDGGDSLQTLFDGFVRKVKMYDSELYWAYSSSIYRRNNDNFEIIATSPATVYDFYLDGSAVYTLTSNTGLYYQLGNEQTRVLFSIFPQNVVGEISSEYSGAYYLANSPPPITRNDGCYRWNGRNGEKYRWRFHGTTTNSNANVVRHVKEILPGVFFMCTWGGGFWVADEINDRYYIMTGSSEDLFLEKTNYQGQNIETEVIEESKIDTIPNVLQQHYKFSNLQIVSNVITDTYNNYVWFSQYETNDRLLVLGYPIMDNTVNWIDTSGIIKITRPTGFSPAVNALGIDQWGNLWIGSTKSDQGGAAGCAVINIADYLNGDIDWDYLNESDNLTSNDVRYIVSDKDGYVWIGTASGINVWTGNELYTGRGYSQPIGLNIQYIFIDEIGNRWFATDQGISMLKYSATPWNSDNEWLHYISDAMVYDDLERPGVFYTNLPKTEFKSVMVDPASGKLLVSSYAGLLTSQKATVLPAFSEKEKVVAFPNPVRFGTRHQDVYFKNVLPGAGIKIYTINGELVRELDADDVSEFEGFWGKWDGKDGAGNQVSSGVYLFSAYTEEGDTQNGKIFVISDN